MRSPRLGLCSVFFQKMVRISKYHGVATSTMFSNLTNEYFLLHDARCMGDGDNYSGPQCIDAILISEFLLHDQFHLKRGCEISYLHVSCN